MSILNFMHRYTSNGRPGSRPLLRLVFCMVSLAMFTVTPVFADFEDLGAGARGAAMGGAYTALSDDVFGMYYNPAGLGLIRTSQVGADFGKLYFGLDDNSNLLTGFSAIALPVTKVQVSKPVSVSTAPVTGAAVNGSTQTAVNVSTGALSVPVSTDAAKEATFRHLGTFALGLRYFSLMDYYQETAYYIGYGRQAGERWAWGVNVKFLQEKYILDEYMKASPVFEKGKKDSVSNVSADVGIIYNLLPNFFMGASVSDINQPNLGLTETDNLPFTGRLGVAWKEKQLAWALDTVYRNKQIYYNTGFERYLNDLFGVRMGLSYGGRKYFNIAGGFSFNFYRVELDYVFQYPLVGLQDIGGTHRMSFIFRFGRKTKDELEMGSLESYYAKTKDELADVTEQLAETKAEKENLEQILIEESTMRIRERIKAAKAEAQAAPGRNASTERPAREAREIRHVVQRGDTLQSIATRYLGDEKYWNEIYQINRENIGRGGTLRPGQVLLIPTLSRAEIGEVSSSPFAAETVPVKVIVPPAPVVTVTEVKPASSAVEIPAVKVIEVKNDLKPDSAGTPAAAASPAKEKAPVRGPRKHVVQSGENLRSIAQKYYGDASRWKEIYGANKGSIISGQVTPGQELTIP